MKRIYQIILILFLSLISCSKEPGCQDENALNYSPNSDPGGTCIFTKAIFYAPSNQVGGNSNNVVRIDIFVGADPNQELIGSITTFGHDVPVDCDTPNGAIEYALPGAGVEYLFPTRYFYDDGSSESGETISVEAFSTVRCREFALTL